MKTNLLIFSLLFFTASCKKENSNMSDVKKESILIKSVEREIDVKEKSFEFYFDSIGKSRMEEGKVVDLLVDNFFNSKNPKILYYALYSSYSINYSDESMNENISLYTYEMFTEDKNKSNILLGYIKKLPKSVEDKITVSIVNMMCLDLGDNQYTFDKFLVDFEKLAQNLKARETAKNCIDNYVN